MVIVKPVSLLISQLRVFYSKISSSCTMTLIFYNQRAIEQVDYRYYYETDLYSC